MRILLQQKETGRYFSEAGTWTLGSSGAMDFMTSTCAIDFCVANRLAGVQIVLKFDEHKCDIVLPVSTDENAQVERPRRKSAERSAHAARA